MPAAPPDGVAPADDARHAAASSQANPVDLRMAITSRVLALGLGELAAG